MDTSVRGVAKDSDALFGAVIPSRVDEGPHVNVMPATHRSASQGISTGTRCTGEPTCTTARTVKATRTLNVHGQSCDVGGDGAGGRV